MVFWKRFQPRVVKKPLKRCNLSGKSFQGLSSNIFARSTTEMSAGFNDGSTRLRCGKRPILSKISLVLRTISTCSIVDSLTVIQSCSIASQGGQCILKLERSLFDPSPSYEGKGNHTLNMCDYHEGEIVVEGLSIRQMKWEVCALRVWWSLRDGGQGLVVVEGVYSEAGWAFARSPCTIDWLGT